MRSIDIFIEGGGSRAAQRQQMRRGFSQLLREVVALAVRKGITVNPIPCGDQGRTCKAFLEQVANQMKGKLCVLLVDADDFDVTSLQSEESRKNHLLKKGKEQLKPVAADQIHLMVQLMETWVVADSAALIAYYGKDFHSNKLPQRADLEEEPKEEVLKKLEAATRDTQKGKYHKINHACVLLERLDPKQVADRCSHFRQLKEYLMAEINAA